MNERKGPKRSKVLIRTLLVALIWSGNSLVYFGLSSWLRLGNGYQDRPLLFALLNGAFLLGVSGLFRHSFLSWKRDAPKAGLFPLVVLAATMMFFLYCIVPVLPAIHWTTNSPMPGLMGATAIYFLPKTLEIMFQQSLILTLIIGFQQQGLPLRTSAVLLSCLFGTFHLALFLNGDDPFYIARYAGAAAMLALVMPWLILRASSGLVYAFGLHWAFYAIDKSVMHFVG